MSEKLTKLDESLIEDVPLDVAQLVESTAAQIHTSVVVGYYGFEEVEDETGLSRR